MPRYPKIPKIMGANEVGEALGVSPQNLNKQAGLPAPRVTYLARGDIWLAAEIEDYKRNRHKRRTKTPQES